MNYHFDLRCWFFTNRYLPFMLLYLLSASSFAEVKAELIKEWQAATVFLEVRDGDVSSGQPAYGTGFIVRENGYVLTAAHVLGSGKNVLINGRTQSRFGELEPLQVVYIEPQYDVALLQFSNTSMTRAKLRIGNPWKLIATSSLTAAGFPVGLDFSVREGSLISTGGLAGRWVTNMALGQGDSGGPVFNQAGEVVAIILASVAGADSLKVVRPMNFARTILESIGVQTALLTPTTSNQEVVSYAVASTVGAEITKIASTRMYSVTFPAKAQFKIVAAQFDPKLTSLIKNPVTEIPQDGSSVNLKFQVPDGVSLEKVKSQIATKGGDLITNQQAK